MERGLSLRKIGNDLFEAVDVPWTWPNTEVIPGGILMALAANAAYATVPEDFSLDAISALFLVGPDTRTPLQQKVQRLKDGGRFATRSVNVEQRGVVAVHATCTFVRTAAMGGPSMTHSCRRRTSFSISDITLDDLEGPENEDMARFMKFQRLGLSFHGEGGVPENLVYVSGAHISPNIAGSDQRLHALGLLCLSDYHVLDAAPEVHGLTVGSFRIGDTTRASTPIQFERFTSVQHSVQFHIHDGYRADEMCYVEVTVPWANTRRAEINSQIFTEKGNLVATCRQEAYYVLKQTATSKI